MTCEAGGCAAAGEERACGHRVCAGHYDDGCPVCERGRRRTLEDEVDELVVGLESDLEADLEGGG